MDLRERLAEAGWPPVERESNAFTVEIDTSVGRYQARLEASHSNQCRVLVDLVETTHCSAASHTAIALLLRATSEAVTTVDAHTATLDGRRWVGLAVTCDAGESVEALDRELSALTVACRLSGREAQALRQDEIASAYLRWRAPASTDEPVEVVPNESAQEEVTCLQA